MMTTQNDDFMQKLTAKGSAKGLSFKFDISKYFYFEKTRKELIHGRVDRFSQLFLKNNCVNKYSYST